MFLKHNYDVMINTSVLKSIDFPYRVAFGTQEEPTRLGNMDDTNTGIWFHFIKKQNQTKFCNEISWNSQSFSNLYSCIFF